jgi:hypothetical protein
MAPLRVQAAQMPTTEAETISEEASIRHKDITSGGSVLIRH